MKSDVEQVGAILRAARQSARLTLEELAADAGMSPSTLSRLESGKRQATLELLIPLTRRLGIRIDDLVAQQPRDPRVRRAAYREGGRTIAPLTPEHSPNLTYKITYPPAEDMPEPRVHDGFEWFYVLSGRLRLRLGEQDILLEAGEAAEFDTRTPHAITAADDAPAEVISIFNEAGARLHTRQP